MSRLFDTILVANRGEIACRVIRTARRLGIRTVAVFSEADRDALHVRMADEAHLIGPAPARHSYLKGDAILDAARASGAQAIHPGYGFLSENADFAEACESAGIAFIGPPASAIRAMGGKSEAKALMDKAGVPLVPGYHGAEQDAEALRAQADAIGYPVLIKASAGGGGKGMRVVEGADDFDGELAGAKREAASSFGDDRVLIEKYLVRPRHVEMQVFADAHGNALHLYERDCSIQRRHQKVIEEAPAPGMTGDLRAEMGSAAVAAAKAIGYVGAGTIEFLLDEDGRFYFMEMNTRLQVEHPVTEAITGLDLVEWQIRVAAGQRMPLTQDAITATGHAIEVRLYAEDPAKNFLPAIGTLRHLLFPAGEHVRVDSGVEAGSAISVHYDPMIAKLIVWGEDRGVAAKRMARALAETEIAGVTTNLAFLERLVSHPGFAPDSGEPDLDTRFIERYGADLLAATAGPEPLDLALASMVVIALARTAAIDDTAIPSPWRAVGAWRLNLNFQETLTFAHGEASATVSLRHLPPDGAVVTVDGVELPARLTAADDGAVSVEIDGVVHRAGFAVHASEQGTRIDLFRPTGRISLVHVDPLALADVAGGSEGSLTAPMPGRVISLLVGEGDEVTQGQPLLVLEAMKMEHTIRAPGDGTVARLPFGPGEQVDDGAELVGFEASEE